MKYNLTTVIIALSLSVSLSSCSTNSPIEDIEQPVIPDGSDNNGPDDNNNGNTNHPMTNNLTLSIGSASFNVTLEDNATATAFKTLFPMTINMSEMNGNEKYYYLPGSLPTASFNPGTIHAGDLMLYGSSCVVLFYKTFSSSYSYTRIGKVDNPSGLSEAVGTGSVSITFKIQDKE